MRLILAWDGELPVGYGLAFDVESDPAKPEWARSAWLSGEWRKLVSARSLLPLAA